MSIKNFSDLEISQAETIKELDAEITQLKEALGIIALQGGEFTQKVVNNALYESGYYIEYCDPQEWCDGETWPEDGC
jgi:hypothetical protein